LNSIPECNDENEEPIGGYYCACKTGTRTLGTCGHISSVVWFLGYTWNVERVKYPNNALLHNILDVGNRMNLNEDIDIIDPDQNENAR